MLKVLRTYRVVALLTAFALVTSAFAPLSAVCGMDSAESIPVSDMPVAPPCHDMGGMAMDHPVPMVNGSPSDLDDSPEVMFTLSCCVAQGPTAPQTEHAAKLVAQVTEVVSATITSPTHEAHRRVVADESPPPQTVSRHLLFGCFLT